MALIHTHIPKRKKRKPDAKQRQLAADWDALLKKYESKKPVATKVTNPVNKTKPYVRETPHYPSLDTGAIGTCTKPVHGKVYTGSAMVGIGTLHKSNAVPIFNIEEAQDQAKMRR
jgi:hypothetical protein